MAFASLPYDIRLQGAIRLAFSARRHFNFDSLCQLTYRFRTFTSKASASLHTTHIHTPFKWAYQIP
ncbi:hypothetical protein DL98DRAFT_522964 [Cadophora sp. DSE1049]|nr:hypothetical protein DL98DRAFT_522964 [Cadophora sp. DSE1049]